MALGRVSALRHQVQLQAIFGLQIDHQPVGCGVWRCGRGAVNRVRRRTKIYLDVRVMGCHTFARTDVKRHARPTPVGNFCAQGHKSFGGAAGLDAFFMQVRWCVLAVKPTSGVLAPHHIARQTVGCPGLE